MIDKVIVAEFLDSGSVEFEGSYNINSRMIGGVFVGKVEFFGDFFQFSNINWPIINCA